MVSIRPEAPIGVFDSGLGGLAVVRELKRAMPGENVLYFGDTARRPYGPQPMKKVREYAVEITRFLIQRGVKAVIIACNTASVAGAEAARRCSSEVPVLDMVGPGVRAALRETRSGRIGVWGTALTIENKAYDQGILRMDEDAEVCGVACPELLRLAERVAIDDRARLTKLALRYFEPIADFGADVLILGCTDLTCIQPIADAVVGEAAVVVDPAQEVISEARRKLEMMGALRVEREGPGSCHYLVSGNDEAEFASFAADFLRVRDVAVTRVSVQEIRKGKGSVRPCRG